MPAKTPVNSIPVVEYAQRHLCFGLWSLLVFAAVGLTLEALHGFKAGAYLDVSNSTRRLMWTLAHAHGTLLSVVNIVYAAVLRTFPEVEPANQRTISRCLLLASFLLPGGFFLGGLVTYGGDPGLGVLLVPVGAVALISALWLLLARLRAH